MGEKMAARNSVSLLLESDHIRHILGSPRRPLVLQQRASTDDPHSKTSELPLDAARPGFVEIHPLYAGEQIDSEGRPTKTIARRRQ
ncbi:MAG: hypothetical protein KC457_17800 [Myxococcales bacterium]|nr:hypothetical protein [Myxococcales bacterium]